MVQIDMEMPKSCRSCQFCNFKGFRKLNFCRLLDITILVYWGKRQEDCPLREVKK